LITGLKIYIRNNRKISLKNRQLLEEKHSILSLCWWIHLATMLVRQLSPVHCQFHHRCCIHHTEAKVVTYWNITQTYSRDPQPSSTQHNTAVYRNSVYPAKGRPGSGITKLDSGTQKRLRRSRPQARARLARAAVVPPASAQASSQTRRRPACVPVQTLSKSAILHRLPNFYTLRVEIFRMFFIRSRLPMTPMNHEKLHVFQKSVRQTQTDVAALYIKCKKNCRFVTTCKAHNWHI